MTLSIKSHGFWHFNHPSSEPLNPLDALMGDAVRRRGSPVYRAARARFGDYSRTLVDHLTAPNQMRAQKVLALPGVGNGAPGRSCDWAVHSVIAMALLSRLHLYVQIELELRGYHRTWYDPTGIDLLKAIRMVVQSRDDDGLVDLIADEAACFLHFVHNGGELENSIRDRLDDIKKLAQETPPRR